MRANVVIAAVLTVASMPASARVLSFDSGVFTGCSGVYSTPLGCIGQLDITFNTDLSTKALENLPFVPRLGLNPLPTDITSTITSFTMTDGIGDVVLTKKNTPAGDYHFSLVTNAQGLPLWWEIDAEAGGAILNTVTEPGVFGGGDSEILASGGDGTAFGRGEWYDGGKLLSMNATMAAPVMAIPEPSTWAMLLVGFGMLGWRLRLARALV